MQVKCPYSTEYRVETDCGRIYAWSAVDRTSLLRELKQKNIKAVDVKPMSEYESEVKAREEQERLNHELAQAVETEGMKRSA